MIKIANHEQPDGSRDDGQNYNRNLFPSCIKKDDKADREEVESKVDEGRSHVSQKGELPLEDSMSINALDFLVSVPKKFWCGKYGFCPFFVNGASCAK